MKLNRSATFASGIAHGVNRFGKRLGHIIIYYIHTVAIYIYIYMTCSLAIFSYVSYPPHRYTQSGPVYAKIIARYIANVYSTRAIQYKSNLNVLNSIADTKSSRSVIPLDVLNRSTRGCSVRR